jgi:hypothetical protein
VYCNIARETEIAHAATEACASNDQAFQRSRKRSILPVDHVWLFVVSAEPWLLSKAAVVSSHLAADGLAHPVGQVPRVVVLVATAHCWLCRTWRAEGCLATTVWLLTVDAASLDRWHKGDIIIVVCLRQDRNWSHLQLARIQR